MDTPEAIVADLVRAVDSTISEEDCARAGRGYVVRIRYLVEAAAAEERLRLASFMDLQASISGEARLKDYLSFMAGKIMDGVPAREPIDQAAFAERHAKRKKLTSG